jgi:hypothetical protein
MVNQARSLLPTDLLTLVGHSGLSYQNQAWPRERLGSNDQAALGVVRDQLLAFARRRSAWVSVRRQRMLGLVGARQRGGSEAWEIDYLIDATKDQSVAGKLLEQAVSEAGKAGAQKLFLRIAAQSPAFLAASTAGFVAYQEERLYVRKPWPDESPLRLRPALPSDSYPLFRLYCAATPEATRRYEAATFTEWHASLEKKWARGGIHLVHEQEGAVRASVRAGKLPQGLIVDLLLDPMVINDARALVAAAAAGSGAQDQPIHVLVPYRSEALAANLEQAGFAAMGDFVSLMRRTARPLSLPKKVAVVAENAVGV